MHPFARVALCVLLGCGAAPLAAQWPNVPTNLPKSPSGAPNLTAPTPTRTDGKTPDLSGTWGAEKRVCDETRAALGCIDAQGGGLPIGFANISGGTDDLLPMQPWAEALVKQRRANGGKDDPFAKCLPVSVPRGWAAFYVLKIVQTADTLAILDEYMLQFRQIFTDGRQLPKNAEPLFKGYSVGKWDGDTLVVETTGFRDDGWLDVWGHPLTDQGRTIERIRRVNVGTLDVQVTVDDPKAYTKPWSVTRKLSLIPHTELLEYVCNENEKSLQHMVGADVK